MHIQNGKIKITTDRIETAMLFVTVLIALYVLY